jgi:hypothetical protein
VSRTVIALALCLLVAGCAAPTAQTQDPTAGTDAPTTTGGSASEAVAPEMTDSSGDTTSTRETTSAADATPTADTASAEVEDDAISVSGGSLPVEHERVFDRTVEMLGANVSPPTRIVVEPAAEIEADTGGAATPSDESAARSFAGVMGIGADGNEGDESENEEQNDGGSDGDGETDEEISDGDSSNDDGSNDDGSNDDSDDEETDDGAVAVAAYAPSAHSVVVNERMTAPGRERALERTLAHEFVHTVQFRQDAFERTKRELDLRYSYSLDRYLTYASVVEGTAVFVADAYDERYLAGEGTAITSTERYRSAPSGVKFAIARYYFGSRYVASRFTSPENVSQLYDDPPRTTEQLLHEDASASEEPRFLAVQVHPGESRSLGPRDTNGELFTRIALGTELNESRAAGAAAGWGADEMVTVEPGYRSGNRSFVWATRWDSPAEADEFTSALEAYLVSRADQSTAETFAREPHVWRDDSISFRAVRVSDETVVLLAGEESFVRTASVSGANASVSVSTV